MVKIVATAEAGKLKPNVSETIRKKVLLIKTFNVDRILKDKEQIREAIYDVCNGKRKYIRGKLSHKWKFAQYMLQNINDYVEKTYEIICQSEAKEKAQREQRYQPGDFPLAYKPKITGEFQYRCKSGKIREVTATLMFPDQVIHQLVVRAMESVLPKGFYHHSYGSIKKKGPHKGAKMIRKYISHNTRNIKYAAELDITKCFQSIPHRRLLYLIRRKFRGHLFFYMCYLIITSYHYKDNKDVGIAIGFVTSHWFCNLYLTPLDFAIKQDLKAPFFIRYVDDMLIFSNSKKKLHLIVQGIKNLVRTYKLKIKDNWQIYRFDYIRNVGKNPRKGRAVDMLGFRYFRDKILIRKHKALEIRKAARWISKQESVSLHCALSFLSRIGQLRHCNSKKFYETYIRDFVDIKYLKEVVRRGQICNAA